MSSRRSAVVVDASSIVDAVIDTGARGLAARSLVRESVSHAPQLIDYEVGNVCRRMALAGVLDDAGALVALQQAQQLIDTRHQLSPGLTAAAWRLRSELTFYDAQYVALASALDLPLLSADEKLLSVARRHCAVVALA